MPLTESEADALVELAFKARGRTGDDKCQGYIDRIIRGVNALRFDPLSFQ